MIITEVTNSGKIISMLHIMINTEEKKILVIMEDKKIPGYYGVRKKYLKVLFLFNIIMIITKVRKFWGTRLWGKKYVKVFLFLMVQNIDFRYCI